MGYRSPNQGPELFNRIVLTSGSDVLVSPGVLIPDIKLDPRAVEIQDMQQPGQAGSVSLQRLEKIWTGVYTYRLWSQADHNADVAFVKILRAGMKKGTSPTGVLGQGRRARVWKLGDPRLSGLDVKDVLIEHISPLVLSGKGGAWQREIKLHEYKKPIPLPLLKVEPTAADKAFERDAKALEAERNSLKEELDKLKKAG